MFFKGLAMDSLLCRIGVGSGGQGGDRPSIIWLGAKLCFGPPLKKCCLVQKGDFIPSIADVRGKNGGHLGLMGRPWPLWLTPESAPVVS